MTSHAMTSSGKSRFPTGPRARRTVSALLAALIVAGPARAATDIQVVDFSAENLSADNEEVLEPGLVQALQSQLFVGGPLSLGTDTVGVVNHLRWFQGMLVEQPAAPNAGLIYLNTLGHAMTFTVLDPSAEGYEVYIDQTLVGRISVNQALDPLVEARLQPMVASVDVGDGNGLQPFSEPSTGSQLVRVNADVPPELAQVVVDESETFLVPGDFVGDRTFTVQFDSAPSPALTNVFGNAGAGEGTHQFGVPAPLPQFQYGDYTSPRTLGHAVIVRIVSKNPLPGDTDGDGVDDDTDNCPLSSNPLQEDSNNNGVGDLCEAPFGC